MKRSVRFLGTQNTRPTTIEMTEKPAVEDDGVVRRDRSRAVRARSLLPFLLWRPPRTARPDGRIAPSPFSLNTLRFSAPPTPPAASPATGVRSHPVGRA